MNQRAFEDMIAALDVMPVLGFDPAAGRVAVLDLGEGGSTLDGVTPGDLAAFEARVAAAMRSVGARVAVGCYDEDRVIYRHSDLFAGDAEPRSLHLGVDLFARAGTEVRAPLAAAVHSFADNRALGDYGPTVILEHAASGVPFWTLYGHLSRESLDGLTLGQKLAAGARVGWLGAAEVNGGWPPHLHFQLITDIGEEAGNFPGVAAPSERVQWLARCPNPNLILRIPGL